MDEEAEDCVVIPFILRLRIDDLSDLRSTPQERRKPGELGPSLERTFSHAPLFSHSHLNCITVNTFNKLVRPLTQADICIIVSVLGKSIKKQRGRKRMRNWRKGKHEEGEARWGERV